MSDFMSTAAAHLAAMGLADGQHDNVELPDGSSFSGQVEAGQAAGQGTWRFRSGAGAVGTWVAGKLHGTECSLTWETNTATPGTTFVGTYVHGTRQGQGVECYGDGSVYEGQWAENAYNGRGTYTYPNNLSYVGEWRNGFREGAGVMRWPDGAMFDGSWHFNSMHGPGTLTHHDGRREEGEWVFGRMLQPER